MTSRDFCFWLQGFFEINNVDKNKAIESLSPQQVAMIENHLALVFRHEISPPPVIIQDSGNKISDALKHMQDQNQGGIITTSLNPEFVYC